MTEKELQQKVTRVARNDRYRQQIQTDLGVAQCKRVIPSYLAPVAQQDAFEQDNDGKEEQIEIVVIKILENTEAQQRVLVFFPLEGGKGK